MKKIVSLLTCLILIFTMSQGLVSCTRNDATAPYLNAQNYEKALVCLANGDYAGAKELFEKLGDYRDSKEYLSNFYYMPVSFEYDLIDKKGTDEIFYDNRNLPKSQAIMRPDAQAIYNYIYDENGNMIKQIVTMNTDDGHVVSIYEYTYDAKNQRIRAEFEMYNGITGFHAFTYDEDRNLIKQAYEDSQGNSYECFMSYDEKGNKIRSENVSGGVSEVINIAINSMIMEEPLRKPGPILVILSKARITSMMQTETSSPRCSPPGTATSAATIIPTMRTATY